MGLLEKTAFALEEGPVVGGNVSGCRASTRHTLWAQGKRVVIVVVVHSDDLGRSGAAYTERFLSSLIAFISIFLRPILKVVAVEDRLGVYFRD